MIANRTDAGCPLAMQGIHPAHQRIPVGRGFVDWLLSALLVSGLMGAATGYRCPASTTPDGVVKSALKVSLTGKETTVDFYLPSGVKNAPVVVVAHGFSRSRQNMAGWGEWLASHGFITAIPDLPAWADHDRNSLAIRELLGRIHSGALVAQPQSSGVGALKGFSMGGLK